MVIKKYGNRRLYDTTRSAYVTLEELADTVRRGAAVRVVDAKTNEDLTQQTLAQIILESRRAADLLPVPLLVQLIRMGDDALAEFLGRFLTNALQLYLQAKQGAQYVTPVNPFAQVPFQATDAMARLFSGFGVPGLGSWPPAGFPGVSDPGAMPPSPPPPAPQQTRPSEQSTADDVAELRRELDELKDALRRKPKK
jgi:polyhydroxyalkanoate synthesis repressor PhaR